MDNLHPKPKRDAVAQVKRHSARVGFLRLLANRPSLTAQEAMDELDDGPATLKGCNYHLWVLCQYGFWNQPAT